MPYSPPVLTDNKSITNSGFGNTPVDKEQSQTDIKHSNELSVYPINEVLSASKQSFLDKQKKKNENLDEKSSSSSQRKLSSNSLLPRTSSTSSNSSSSSDSSSNSRSKSKDKNKENVPPSQPSSPSPSSPPSSPAPSSPSTPSTPPPPLPPKKSPQELLNEKLAVCDQVLQSITADHGCKWFPLNPEAQARHLRQNGVPAELLERRVDIGTLISGNSGLGKIDDLDAPVIVMFGKPKKAAALFERDENGDWQMYDRGDRNSPPQKVSPSALLQHIQGAKNVTSTVSIFGIHMPGANTPGPANPQLKTYFVNVDDDDNDQNNEGGDIGQDRNKDSNSTGLHDRTLHRQRSNLSLFNNDYDYGNNYSYDNYGTNSNNNRSSLSNFGRSLSSPLPRFSNSSNNNKSSQITQIDDEKKNNKSSNKSSSDNSNQDKADNLTS